jgi:hypothetical protein
MRILWGSDYRAGALWAVYPVSPVKYRAVQCLLCDPYFSLTPHTLPLPFPLEIFSAFLLCTNTLCYSRFNIIFAFLCWLFSPFSSSSSFSYHPYPLLLLPSSSLPFPLSSQTRTLDLVNSTPTRPSQC